jgi:hypothetical protein
MTTILRSTITALSFAIVVGCSSGTGDIAGASETTNGIVVASWNASVSIEAAPGVAVSIYSENYEPVFRQGVSEVGVTDSTGHILFDSLIPGHYNVLARNLTQSTAAFVPAVAVFSDSSSRRPARLDTSGSIEGVVSGVIGVIAVFVTGSPFQTMVDQSGTFSLQGIPAGVYRLHARQIVTPIKTDPVYADSSMVTVLRGERSILVFQ